MLVPLKGLSRQHADMMTKAGMPALALSSSSTTAEWARCKTMITEKALCALFISPEVLCHNPSFVKLLNEHNIALLCFDEAHLYNDWYLWRPTMSMAASLVSAQRRLGLTATMRRRDQQLVIRRTGMSAPIVQRGRFLRSNLLLQVVKRPAALTFGRASLADRLSAATEAKWRIARTLRMAIKARSLQGNTIVYVPSRAQAETVCKQLVLAAKDQKLVAAGAALKFRPYHAGRTDRAEVEQLFLSQRGVVVVATIAFGLGVDCAHVRVIIHFVRCWYFAHLFWSPYSILVTILAGFLMRRTGSQLDIRS